MIWEGAWFMEYYSKIYREMIRFSQVKIYMYLITIIELLCFYLSFHGKIR